jgi:hypothetical protein
MNKRIRLDQRGVASMLLVIVGVVVIAAVVFAGYKVANNHKSSTASNAPAKSTTSANTTVAASSSCVAAYHDNNLCKFAGNSTSFAKTAYTATLHAVQQGTASTMTLKNDGKGNTELTSTQGGQTLSAISLDGNEYIQATAGGPWIKYPTGVTAPTSNPASNMKIGVGSSGITYKALGTAACGNLTCFKYQVTDSATPNVTQYAWFDNSNYQLREWQYTDASGNTTDMTINYGPVTISTPSPVQSYTTPAAQ